MATVLVIDDDRDVRAFMERTLSRAGYLVFTADNGLDGFRHFRDNPCDVVITDLAMPGQDGLETIAAIRREFPASRIVAVDDTGGDVLLNLARALGASQTFRKPVDAKRLIAAVGALAPSV